MKLNTKPNHSKLKEYLSKTGRLNKSKVGRFTCLSVKQRFYNAANELLDKDEFSLISQNLIETKMDGKITNELMFHHLGIVVAEINREKYFK